MEQNQPEARAPESPKQISPELESEKKLSPWNRWVTLVIILVITVLVGIIAIPLLLRLRISNNEVNAIGFLRTLSTAQAQFQSAACVDQDGDETGEYGLLNELSANTNIRGPKGGQKNPISPGYITSAARVVTANGYATRSGFLFQVFLPHAGAVLTDTGKAQNGSTDAASINAQENNWIAYAWPKVWGTTGIHCFVDDQTCEATGAVNTKNFATKEAAAFYDGNTHRPSYNAAMLKDDEADSLHFKPRGMGYECVDGQGWTSG